MKLTGKVDKLGFEIKEHDVIVAIVGMSPVTGVVTLKDDKWVFRRLMMTPDGATVEEFDLSNIESKDIGVVGNVYTETFFEAPRRDRIRGRIRSHADNESARRRPRNEGF